MSIAFSPDRWAKIKADARAWWAGDLKRPLIQMRLTGRDPGRPPPRLTRVAQDVTSYDLSVSAEEIVDRWDYELSQLEFLGDGFPHVWPNFGPGVVAAFLDAKVDTRSGTVWFSPSEEKELRELRFERAPGNPWLERVKEICRAALARWQGLVQVDMTDLGGTLDILSTYRPGEKLPMDLLDAPDEVRRCIWAIHRRWWEYFEEIQAVLRPVNPGYTAWTSIFSESPYYMLQCDFSHMISPEMFDEFVKPELTASCQRLGNAFYHLDGPGQLPHLDALLAIKELRGIQWIPGARRPDFREWMFVYRKIR